VTIAQGLGLGVLQGLTEFLPVSSSGHLVLARELLRIKEPAVEFVVLVHAGSLLAILVYFWRDILSLVTTRRRLLVWLGIGSVPAAAVYAVFKDAVEAAFERPLVVGVALLVTGAVLLAAERLASDERSLDEVTWLDGLLVGLAQAAALVPGISRSGMTIGSGLARGLERRAAVSFAFLLGAVAIGGGTVLKCRDFGTLAAAGGWAPVVAGFVASAVVSLGSLVLLTLVVRRKRLAGFAIYCFLVGGGVMLAKLTGLW
jgi:undecaprenyl-diphosphatase